MKKRLISILLCICFLINIIPSIGVSAAQSGKSDDVRIYIVPIIFNEHSGEYTFYGIDGKFYLSLRDIASLTRYSYSEQGDLVFLTQGVRVVEITKSTGQMYDCDLLSDKPLDVKMYEGMCLAEAIPMLTYLGASCSKYEDDGLIIVTPPVTIWEAIAPGFDTHYIDQYDMYTDEDLRNFSICLDIFADLLDFSSGRGLFNSSRENHKKDALYEIVSLDISEYGGTEKADTDISQNVSSAFSGESFYNFVDTAGLGYSVAETLVSNVSEVYLVEDIAKNELSWTRAFNAGNTTECSKISLDINKQTVKQANVKANAGKASAIGTFLPIALSGLNAALTANTKMKYDEDSKNIFKAVFEDGATDYIDYKVEWQELANEITKELKSYSGILSAEAKDKVIPAVVEMIVTEAAGKAASAFASKYNAVALGLSINSYLHREAFDAYSADLNAAFLRGFVDDTQFIATYIMDNSLAFDRHSAKSLGYLKDALELYYRTAIAFGKNTAVSVKQFNMGKNSGKIADYYGTTLCDTYSYYLYKLTNCTVVPITQIGKDTLLTEPWMRPFEVISDYGYGVDIRDNTYYWKFTPESIVEGEIIGSYGQTENTDVSLMRIDGDGKETEILKTESAGIFAATSNRLFFCDDNKQIYSTDLDGKDRKQHGTGTIVGITDSGKNLIFTNGSCIYSLNTISNKTVTLSLDAEFTAIHKGRIYYEPTLDTSEASKGKLSLYSVLGDGSDKIHIYTTQPDLYDYSGVSSAGISQICFGTEYIYFSYGSSGGSGMFFQGGKVIRVGYDGTGGQVVAGNDGTVDSKFSVNDDGSVNANPYSSSEIFARYKNEFFEEDGNIYQYDVETGRKVLICSCYPDSDYEFYIPKFISANSKHVFFVTHYGHNDPTKDFGWRPYYTRDKSVFYMLDRETGEIVLTYQF